MQRIATLVPQPSAVTDTVASSDEGATGLMLIAVIDVGGWAVGVGATGPCRMATNTPTASTAAAAVESVQSIQRIRPRRVVPFDEIEGILVEHNRPRNLYRVVALVGDGRVALGRSFVEEAEVTRRVGAIAEWMGNDGPPVDQRLDEDEPA